MIGRRTVETGMDLVGFTSSGDGLEHKVQVKVIDVNKDNILQEADFSTKSLYEEPLSDTDEPYDPNLCRPTVQEGSRGGIEDIDNVAQTTGKF